MEIWKEWKPGILVSNMGNINGISIFDRGQGYYACTYKKKTYNIHKIIAELFIENPDNKPCVDHINRNRKDNRVENLRWATYSENNLNTEFKCRNHKKIVCIETGEIFNSAYDIRHNKNDSKNIKRAITKNMTINNLHFKYWEGCRHEEK